MACRNMSPQEAVGGSGGEGGVRARDRCDCRAVLGVLPNGLSPLHLPANSTNRGHSEKYPPTCPQRTEELTWRYAEADRSVPEASCLVGGGRAAHWAQQREADRKADPGKATVGGGDASQWSGSAGWRHGPRQHASVRQGKRPPSEIGKCMLESLHVFTYLLMFVMCINGLLPMTSLAGVAANSSNAK